MQFDALSLELDPIALQDVDGDGMPRWWELDHGFSDSVANAAKEVFLEAPHACLNAKGQLVDRWGSPLFFHVRDANRIDLRSAGPDGEMWTADDLHRRHDGEFFRGEMLPSENPHEG